MEETKLDERTQEIESTKTTLEDSVGKTVIGTMLGMLGIGLLARSYNMDPNFLSPAIFYLSGAGSILGAAYFFGTGIHILNDNIEKLYHLATKNDTGGK